MLGGRKLKAAFSTITVVAIGGFASVAGISLASRDDSKAAKSALIAVRGQRLQGPWIGRA